MKIFVAVRVIAVLFWFLHRFLALEIEDLSPAELRKEISRSSKTLNKLVSVSSKRSLDNFSRNLLEKMEQRERAHLEKCQIALDGLA